MSDGVFQGQVGNPGAWALWKETSFPILCFTGEPLNQKLIVSAMKLDLYVSASGGPISSQKKH